MVDPGRVLLCSLLSAVLYLSLRQHASPRDCTLTLPACPGPGVCGHQGCSKPRAGVSRQGWGLVEKGLCGRMVTPAWRGAPSGGLGEGTQLTSPGPRGLCLQHFPPGWIVERWVLMNLYFMLCDFNVKLSGSDS